MIRNNVKLYGEADKLTLYAANLAYYLRVAAFRDQAIDSLCSFCARQWPFLAHDPAVHQDPDNKNRHPKCLALDIRMLPADDSSLREHDAAILKRFEDLEKEWRRAKGM